MKKTKGQKIKAVTIRLSEDDLEKFSQSAKENARSVSSEFLFRAMSTFQEK